MRLIVSQSTYDEIASLLRAIGEGHRVSYADEVTMEDILLVRGRSGHFSTIPTPLTDARADSYFKQLHIHDEVAE